MPLSKNAQETFRKRYCSQGETSKERLKAVAEALSLGDDKFESKLYKAMVNGYFLPNSPCIKNAGHKKGMLHACFKLPVEDNIASIFEAIKNMAVIFHYGGGSGFNFSNLRPKGSFLSTGGRTSGVVSFMEIFNATTDAVYQGGMRKGASLGVLNHNHPEVMEFARAKLLGGLTNFNISVLVNDEFMNKIEKNEKIDLKFKGETWRKVGAKDLFELICWSAWNTGDPGLIFFDRINKDNPYYPEMIIDGCNPCGEVPLFDYGACCLGSINVSKFIKSGKFNFAEFNRHVELATRALLNMNAISWYPLPQITKMMKEHNPIGVGIMGFADALIKLGIHYDSEDCLKFIDSIAESYIAITNKKAKGSFYKRIIAPTGTLSILADCSSGIEPVFARNFERHLTIGIIKEQREIYKSKYCKVAEEISAEWHLKVQARWQEKIDGAVSKTINLANSATGEDIEKIYYQAWKMGCKGTTVFRDDCKKGVLKKCEGDVCTL